MSDTQPKVDRFEADLAAHRAKRARGALTTLVLALVVSLCAVGLLLARQMSEQAQVHELRQDTPTMGEVVVTDAMDDASDGGEAAPAPEPEPEQEPVTVRLMMIGDMLMHMGVIESGNNGDGTYSYDHLFAGISEDITEADIAVLNQETILGGPDWAYSGYPIFNTPQALGDAEAAAGFDVILKATNHTLDLGYDGVRSELAYWASAHPDMAVIGMADPDGDGIAPTGGTSAAGPWYFEKDGLRIALLNYTDILNDNVDPDYDWRVVSIAYEQNVRADVAAAKEQADLVVVFMHWGQEYETEPFSDELWWEQVLFDCGVDVVVGGHPHVIQPVEVFDDGQHRMLVMWSVGNFVSTQAGADNMVGGMAKLTFTKDAEGARLSSYEFVPTVTLCQPYSRAMCAYKLPDFSDERAAQSNISSIDKGNGATQQWYVDYCAQVLGDSFDFDTLSVHGEL